MSARVDKPWGYYRVLLSFPGYQVKELYVNPEGKLSLQSHEHRNEHWFIVSGWGIIEIDGYESCALPGLAIDIPKGSKHRISNCSNEPFVVIEIQTGDYLGEDDIIRYKDIYSRA